MGNIVRIIAASALLLLPSLLFAGETKPTMAPGVTSRNRGFS